MPHRETSPKRFTMATLLRYSLHLRSSCRVTVALHSAIWISTEVVTTLFGCYMAGVTWNCCRLGASSVYTMQPYNQCHFIRSYIATYTCVRKTARDLSRAIAVTRVALRSGSTFCADSNYFPPGDGYRNKSQHRKLTLEKKILPPLLPRLEPETLDHDSAALPLSHSRSPKLLF